MRTTLTLDPDVAQLIADAAHSQRRPVKQVVNDALRRALAPERPRERFEVTPHRTALRPGFDLAGSDELEDETIIDSTRPAS